MDKEFDPFICGCGFIQKKRVINCINHIKMHQEILPANSSHVLMRKSQGLSGRRKIKLGKLRIDAKNNGQKYFCPCKP
jgi:hypothetical protein